jgi:hypothetical protein
VLALALATAALLHPDSLSSSRIRVHDNGATAVVRCQVLSLTEVLELDADRDGRVSADEVAAQSDAIVDYVESNYFLYTESNRELTQGTPLESLGGHVRFVAPVVGDPLTRAEGAVDVELTYTAAAPIRDLMVEMSLFLETSPGHIDVVSVVWESGAQRIFTLTESDPRERSDPAGRGALAAFLELGVHHILSGWDHLAFVLVLVLGAKKLRALLWLVTSFTFAHSVTLVLTALGVVRLGMLGGLVEAAVALSIAYVAADTALRPKLERARWPEAFGFGLLHGCAFASFLGQSVVHEETVGLALFGFNLGVELGQVLVVLVVALLLRLFVRSRDGFLAPEWMRRTVSIGVVLAGLWWFFERI